MRRFTAGVFLFRLKQKFQNCFVSVFVSVLFQVFQLCGEFNGAKLTVQLTNDTYDFESVFGTKGGTLRARTATLLKICASYTSIMFPLLEFDNSKRVLPFLRCSLCW